MNKSRSVSLNPPTNSYATNEKYANLKLDIVNDYKAQLDPIKSFKFFLQKIIEKKNEEISHQNPNSDQEEEKVVFQPRNSKFLSSNFVERKSNDLFSTK